MNYRFLARFPIGLVLALLFLMYVVMFRPGISPIDTLVIFLGIFIFAWILRMALWRAVRRRRRMANWRYGQGRRFGRPPNMDPRQPYGQQYPPVQPQPPQVPPGQYPPQPPGYPPYP